MEKFLLSTLFFSACISLPNEDVGDKHDYAESIGENDDDLHAQPKQVSVHHHENTTTAFHPGTAPTSVIKPKYGELTFYQLKLPPGLSAKMGEASIIVGPKGSIALLDIGNTTHHDEVRDAIRDLNTRWLTPENGFEARAPLQVDWIILSHLHGDHIGSFRKLLMKRNPLTGLKGIIHRGFVDLGSGMTGKRYKEFCEGMRGTYQSIDIPLCESAVPATCNHRRLRSSYRATNCDGLLQGNLETSADDGQNKPASISLDGAMIEFVGVNGYFNNGNRLEAINSFGHNTGSKENARSLVGIVSYGDFRYHFGGDLHGKNDGKGPDVETHLVETSGDRFYGSLGMDVTHAHHHARKTSSNETFVDAMAPIDGKSRNVVAGISMIHLGSPHQNVLDIWDENNRLGNGHIWITRNTFTGSTGPNVINARGSLIIQTSKKGQGYWIQAVGKKRLQSQSFQSVRN